MYIVSIKKDYGKSSKIIEYRKGVDISPPKCDKHERISCPECYTRKVNSVASPSSIQRSKSRITDYVLANEFDLFCTFTYNPELVDSFDIKSGKEKMSKWLNNQRRHSPDLIYLVIPELHKSGRIHFHALMKNYNGSLIETHRLHKNRKIYNLENWRYGYSTVIKIDHLERVSNYVQKYITKDMLKISNKKRYFASKNLIKPKVDYNINMEEHVYTKPLFITSQFHADYYKIYTIKNS